MARKMTGRKATKRPASKLKLSRREGGMTVREAGRLGGLIGGRKGGLTVKAERGVEFYQEIGKIGRASVRESMATARVGGWGDRRSVTERDEGENEHER